MSIACSRSNASSDSSPRIGSVRKRHATEQISKLTMGDNGENSLCAILLQYIASGLNSSDCVGHIVDQNSDLSVCQNRSS
jgi:hypothetical protein